MVNNTENRQADARVIIDTIVYLSSLVSNPKAIDPYLDNMRIVTSRVGTDGELSAQDRSLLQSVKDEIENYLVTKEPIRNFTREELTERVRKNFLPEEVKRAAKKLRLQFIYMWLFSALAYVVAFLLPFGDSLAQRAQLALPVFMVAIHIGIVWFYVSALKTSSKNSELLICLSWPG